MASFRCYDNSGVIATLIMTNFHLNKTVVANFPNACLFNTQTWYWPWNLTVSSHLHMPVRPMCNTALLSFRLFRKNLGNLQDFLGQMVYRPPWQKNSHTPMSEILPGLLLSKTKFQKNIFLSISMQSRKKKLRSKTFPFQAAGGFQMLTSFTIPTILACP